jgi:hypothetical protein
VGEDKEERRGVVVGKRALVTGGVSTRDKRHTPFCLRWKHHPGLKAKVPKQVLDTPLVPVGNTNMDKRVGLTPQVFN